jgi:hypothetical protein
VTNALLAGDIVSAITKYIIVQGLSPVHDTHRHGFMLRQPTVSINVNYYIL